jgi:hypothetical protein
MKSKIGMVVAAVTLIASAPAAAAPRYASPTGSGTSCTEAAPCDLETAVEGVGTLNGDEVIVAPGTHTVAGNLSIAKALDVHPSTGVPTIVADSVGINVAGAKLTSVRIDASDSIGLNFSSGSVSRVYVNASANNAIACRLLNVAPGPELSDSVCRATGSNGMAIYTQTCCGASVVANFRNVTAFASGTNSYGIRAEGIFGGGPAGGNVVINARNVIAAGNAADVSAATDGTGSAFVNLSNSNFDPPQIVGAGASATAPTTAANQTAGPVFLDSVSGDFRQAENSPTIDAGSAASPLGLFDVDGDPRLLGAAPDIGADEYVPPAVPDTTAPETTIKKQPKRKSSKAKAKVTFTADDPEATFECKLDKSGYKSCSSPFKKKVKDGKHKFQVRATDAAGNTEQTPAKAKWKVI